MAQDEPIVELGPDADPVLLALELGLTVEEAQEMIDAVQSDWIIVDEGEEEA